MNRNDLPTRLATRPFDERRGLPVPYVSEHDDGSVDFATLNGRRVLECARDGLCSACGQPHEYRLAFIGGPGGFAQRRYTDAPMHLGCARWSLTLCPYLQLEQFRRRSRNTGPQVAPGFVEMEKADPVIMAVTRGYTVAVVPGADGLATVEFRAASWTSAIRFDYRDGQLSETGPIRLR